MKIIKKIHEFLLRFNVGLMQLPERGDKTDENFYVMFNISSLLFYGTFFYYLYLKSTGKDLLNIMRVLSILLFSGAGAGIFNLFRVVRFRSKLGVLFTGLYFIVLIILYSLLKSSVLSNM